MADRVGQQLGNYRLLRLIGQGGFAEVYLGEHIYLDTQAAIKVLHTRLASDEVVHFQAEARTVARLVHPHVVRVLDYGVDGSTPFLVVDYAPNGTLRQRHPKGVPLPLATVISYVTQIADALQYAHEQKVIHRDVKPENMLVGRRDEILLSDFGIALVAQSSNYHSTEGLQDLAGTIVYMAPEQIQAQAVPKSDQYSLGVVAYEWLSGTRPFQGSFAEIAVKHTLMSPPSLLEQIPTLPLAVEEVIMKALAKDPKQRFTKVQDFASALQEASRGDPTSAPQHQSSPPAETVEPSNQDAFPLALRTPSSPPPPTTVVLSNELSPVPTTTSLPNESPPQPATTSLDTVGAGLAPAPGSLSEGQGMERTPVPDQPVTLSEPSTSLTPPTPSTPLKQGLSRRTVVVGLAGVAIVSAVGGGIGWLAHLQGHQSPSTSAGAKTLLYTFRGHTSWVWSVAWSPKQSGGLRVASASGDGTAQVWDAANGDHLNVYSGHSDSVYAVTWSPDGLRIASAGNDKTVQVWDATFGDHFYTYTGHTSWVWSAAWSPDGSRIASGGGDKTVQIFDAATGHHIYTYRGHTDFVHAVAWSPNGRLVASASNDGTVQVWNAADGSQLFTFQPYAASMWSLAWSPNGSRIASASSNGTVQVWDATNGNHLYVYYGHSDFVYAVAWSPNGQRIASGGDDKTVQVWNAAYGAHPSIYTGHSNAVRAVSWSPDSKRIASGSWDKTVQVWQAF